VRTLGHTILRYILPGVIDAIYTVTYTIAARPLPPSADSVLNRVMQRRRVHQPCICVRRVGERANTRLRILGALYTAGNSTDSNHRHHADALRHNRVLSSTTPSTYYTCRFPCPGRLAISADIRKIHRVPTLRRFIEYMGEVHTTELGLDSDMGERRVIVWCLLLVTLVRLKRNTLDCREISSTRAGRASLDIARRSLASVDSTL
jgi:hypothetical protein